MKMPPASELRDWEQQRYKRLCQIDADAARDYHRHCTNSIWYEERGQIERSIRSKKKALEISQHYALKPGAPRVIPDKPIVPAIEAVRAIVEEGKLATLTRICMYTDRSKEDIHAALYSLAIRGKLLRRRRRGVLYYKLP